MSSTLTAAEFKVGDRVWVPMPLGRASGKVIEDRGHIGRGGRRLYYVAVPNHPYANDKFLVGEDEIEHVNSAEEADFNERLDSQAIKDFLIRDGGLISILVANSLEPVWLRRGPHGKLTYTYIDGYSSTGGEAAPVFAVSEEKVSAGKRDAVVKFLQTFGLSDKDAEEVVNKIGEHP